VTDTPELAGMWRLEAWVVLDDNKNCRAFEIDDLVGPRFPLCPAFENMLSGRDRARLEEQLTKEARALQQRLGAKVSQ
jgi:hypothetical protein